ncbi:MAG: CDP-diacylglycerol--glycerol-3-phosphate 3-phosphatidyltransferase [Lachnospiraceae bacterium]|nr:CDP-diacylglycerol--glycerol-3-phosphate 3-phosphatidyltransferase [Lachnospiraceae bacterium]
MNLPNKLTVFRVVLIPFFVIVMLAQPFGDLSKFVAVGIFIVASLTDFLDGYIARKHNLVSNFGKFMDPLADKLLVGAAMICLCDVTGILPVAGKIPGWIVIIIISREYFISGFRTIAADQGLVLAAGWWGKVKTVCQMFMIIFLIVNLNFTAFKAIEVILVWLSLFFTVFSMIDYVAKNREVLKDEVK